MIHIYFIKFIKAFFFLRKGCRPWGYIARLFLSVLLCYLLLCFYDIHIKSFRDSRLRSYWIYIYIYIHDMTNTLYRYMYIIYFLSLVKVAIGIDSSVVTVALVLIRTPCRRPGSRDYYYRAWTATRIARQTYAKGHLERSRWNLCCVFSGLLFTCLHLHSAFTQDPRVFRRKRKVSATAFAPCF